jgi:predicted MPP superfamily phosphohydrolase
MVRWIIFFLIYAFFSFYAYQAVKTATRFGWVHIFFIIVSVLVFSNFVYQFTVGSESRALTQGKSFALWFLITFMTFKMVVIPLLLGEDILRAVIGINDKFIASKEHFAIPSRRKFVSQIALGIAAIPMLSLLYGMYRGKYNFRVLKYTLHFEDLPEAFDGYRLTQLSDIHSGSFDNKGKIKYAIDLVNEQQSDCILFTGDLVNNKADEMLPWKDLFGQLKAKDGVYSVLGNHDYGDYIAWNSAEEKNKNLENLKEIQREMGFNLLLNESAYLKKNGQRLALIGVENWGKGGFKKAGDFKKASEGLDKNDFKILMSHDPSHWEEVVLNDDMHVHLTLSGHTHGMQFGIEIPGWIKWSPVSWRYKYWAGIYKEKNQYINVNRGFGYLAYPGRVGIWPEITVIELKKGNSSA